MVTKYLYLYIVMKYSKRTKKNKNGMNGGVSPENSHSSRHSSPENSDSAHHSSSESSDYRDIIPGDVYHIVDGDVSYSINIPEGNCAICGEPHDESSFPVHSHVTNRSGPPHIFHADCIYNLFYHSSDGNRLRDSVLCPLCRVLAVYKVELFRWIYRKKIFLLQTNLEHMTVYLNSVLVRINSQSEDQINNGAIHARLLRDFSRILPNPDLQNAFVPREQNAIIHQNAIDRLDAIFARIMDNLSDSTNITGRIIARNLINLDNYLRIHGLHPGYGVVIATGVYLLFNIMRNLLGRFGGGGGEGSINEKSKKKIYRLCLPINELDEFCIKLDKDEEFKKNRETYFNEPIIISVYPKKFDKSSKHSKKHAKHDKSGLLKTTSMGSLRKKSKYSNKHQKSRSRRRSI